MENAFDPTAEIADEKMSAGDFKDCREQLGLSTRELAYVLGVNERTIRRWEDPGREGVQGPNPAAARAMLWMLEDGIKPPELLEVRRAQGR